MPIVGGEIRDLTRLTQPSEVGVGPREIVSMKWTPDGKTLLYQVEWPDRDGEPELWQVRVEGGAPARLDLPLLVQNRMVPSRLSFHPDGRTIAFWTERGRSEVWLMEGFPWQDAKR
jgi:Tol biopolymer transport system component